MELSLDLPDSLLKATSLDIWPNSAYKSPVRVAPSQSSTSLLLPIVLERICPYKYSKQPKNKLPTILLLITAPFTGVLQHYTSVQVYFH